MSRRPYDDYESRRGPPRRSAGDSYESRYGPPSARVVEDDYATYRPPDLFGREDSRGSSARRDAPPSSAYDTYRPPTRRGPPPRAAAAPRENDYSAYDTYRPPSKPSAEYARNMERFAGVQVRPAPSRDPVPRHRKDRRSSNTDSDDDSEDDRARRRRAAKKKKALADENKKSRKGDKKSRKNETDSDSSDSDSDASSSSSSSSSDSGDHRRKSKGKTKSGSSRKKKKSSKKDLKKSRSSKKSRRDASSDDTSSSSSSSSSGEETPAVMGIQSSAVAPAQANVDALGAAAFGTEGNAFPDLIGEAPVTDYSNMPGEDPIASQSSVGTLAGRFPQLGSGNQQALVPSGMPQAMGMGMVQTPFGMMPLQAAQQMMMSGNMPGGMQMMMPSNMQGGMGQMGGMSLNQDNLTSDFGNMSMHQGPAGANSMFPNGSGL